MEQSTLILNKKNKLGQVWSLDIIIAGIIITTGIIILYIYAINYTNQSQENLDYLFYEGNLASQLILSEESFGVFDETGQINQSKLDDYYYNYDSKKNVLGITKDFYFELDNITEANGTTVSYIGKKSSTTSNSIKITRIAIYKNQPIKFDLYVWD
ncbi:MAG: hypothetical protein AABW51_02075 [Nanoarchaeota archaeon]